MAIKYARLFSPTTQFQTRSGALNTAGLLRVFINNTDDLAQVYNDNMELMRQPIVLDDNGRAQGVFCDIKKVYRLEVYDRNDSLLFTIPNLQATEAAGGSTIITPGSMQHWLGMYGPTYTPFPGDNAGHTLGIPRNEIEYVGNFIDHFDTCPYPDSTPVGYIYLKPGLYFVSCIIRYQQDPEALSNTLDEVLVYTGHGNANESLAYQMDSSGPETTGNRHNVRVQFIRKVPEDAETEILYFAPGTPIAWKEAYIQRLEIVKLDGIKGEPGEQGPKGDTGPQGPQGEIPFTVPFEAGDGIIMELDSDGEELKVIISVDSDSVPAGETGATGADGKSAYQIWLEQGNTGTEQDFLDSLVGATGAQGIQGIQGVTGPQGPQGSTGAQGQQGIQGIQGQTGADGKSAYEIWLENGHTGSEQDFLNSLVGATGANGQNGATGADGKSAYEIWLEQGNTGSEQDFLNSLVGATGANGQNGSTGATGADGKSAYEIWLEQGNTGSEQDFLNSLVGATGANGQNGATGADGKSAYEIWLENGHTGSEQDFLNSLVGATGETGADGQVGATGADGKSAYEIWLENGHSGTEEDFLASLVGATGQTGATGSQGPVGSTGSTGADGKSAYEIWLDNGHTGTEQDFLNSLVGATGATGADGADGATGADGKSAYEIWLENGHTGTESDFLASLVGATGATGMTGAEGPQGATGPSVQTDWDATDSDGLDYLKNKPTPKTLTAGQNISITETASTITISATGGQNPDLTYDSDSTNAQSGIAVAEAVAGKADEFEAGDGLEFSTDSDGNKVLQVDIVDGPGINIDKPGGNHLRISSDANSFFKELYYNATNTNDTAGKEYSLNEPITNFMYAKITVDNMEFSNRPLVYEIDVQHNTTSCVWNSPLVNGNVSNTINLPVCQLQINSSGNLVLAARGLTYNTYPSPWFTDGDSRGMRIVRVVGIFRIASNQE